MSSITASVDEKQALHFPIVTQLQKHKAEFVDRVRQDPGFLGEVQHD